MTTRSSAPTQRRQDADEPIEQQKAPPRRTGAFWRLAACGLLFLFGAPLWLAGARYTLDGWLTGANFLAGWLHTPWRVPALEWRVYLGLVIGLGLAYSAVEVALYTTARARRLGRVPTVLWALWLLVLLTDIGSTFLGVITPEPGAPPLATWAAQTWVVAGIWSTVLTFGPEWFIIGGTKLLRG
jgi:hypothetical protein